MSFSYTVKAFCHQQLQIRKGVSKHLIWHRFPNWNWFVSLLRSQFLVSFPSLDEWFCLVHLFFFNFCLVLKEFVWSVVVPKKGTPHFPGGYSRFSIFLPLQQPMVNRVSLTGWDPTCSSEGYLCSHEASSTRRVVEGDGLRPILFGGNLVIFFTLWKGGIVVSYPRMSHVTCLIPQIQKVVI